MISILGTTVQARRRFLEFRCHGPGVHITKHLDGRLRGSCSWMMQRAAGATICGEDVRHLRALTSRAVSCSPVLLGMVKECLAQRLVACRLGSLKPQIANDLPRNHNPATPPCPRSWYWLQCRQATYVSSKSTSACKLHRCTPRCLTKRVRCRYGKRIREVYRLWQGAEGNIKGKVLVLEAILSRTAVQLEFLKRVAGSMGEEHCRVHLQVLETLKSHLRMAAVKIESVLKSDSKSGVKPVKYLFLHNEIEESMAQLEQWQRVFDPTWYLILRIGDKVIDAELAKPPDQMQPEETDSLSLSGTTAASVDVLAPAKKLRSSLTGGGLRADAHIYLPEDGLDWQRATPIAYSTTRLIPRASKGQRVFAVDTIDCTKGVDLSQTRADAEALAKKLDQIDPGTFGLLSCHGLVKQKQPESRRVASISLIFQMPASEREPVSLRSTLLHSAKDSLSRTLAIARQLARAVSFVHTCDFVHKNIRPETVLMFPDEAATPPCALGATYLVGFDSFRNVRFQTLRRGDAAWERNLYRHPSRQGIFAQEEYIMQHDVYSLGVCLLELGLWESFVRYEADNESEGDSGDPTALPSESLGLSAGDFEFSDGAGMQQLSRIKHHLVDLARARLPARMGDKYTAVVLSCLACLDEGNEDFGSDGEMRDDDGVLIGVRFIEKVLLKLGNISM